VGISWEVKINDQTLVHDVLDLDEVSALRAACSDDPSMKPSYDLLFGGDSDQMPASAKAGMLLDAANQLSPAAGNLKVVIYRFSSQHPGESYRSTSSGLNVPIGDVAYWFHGGINKCTLTKRKILPDGDSQWLETTDIRNLRSGIQTEGFGEVRVVRSSKAGRTRKLLAALAKAMSSQNPEETCEIWWG
jgi:hypothetical protein